MQDFVIVTGTQMAAAVSSATKIAAVVLGDETKAIMVDNGFNQDLVVMVNEVKPFYVRAGAAKLLDLSTDNSSFPATRTIGLYSYSGTPPTISDTAFTVIDCLL